MKIKFNKKDKKNHIFPNDIIFNFLNVHSIWKNVKYSSALYLVGRSNLIKTSLWSGCLGN
jgi:hypothetical protein